jgi:thiamine-phosphate pyrophosphorylase
MGKPTKEELRAALRLYGVSDSSNLHGRSLPAVVEEICANGTTMIQLRDKDPDRGFVSMRARALLLSCRANKALFVVNDDVEIAKLVGADGVHLGQNDMPCEKARAFLGEGFIIGVSVQTVEQALEAQAAGADYLGVGAMIATPTKPDAEIVSVDTLRAIVEAVDLPVVAIGGINAETIGMLEGTGIDGVAVVSALFKAVDPKAASLELRALVDKIVG